MQAALVVTWSAAKDGREMKALEYAAEVAEYWGKKAADGKCTVPEMFMSPATGQGTWIVKGERATLQELQDDNAARMLLARGHVLLEHFTSEIELADESVQEYFTMFANAVESVR
jgi:hypothetical protein